MGAIALAVGLSACSPSAGAASATQKTADVIIKNEKGSNPYGFMPKTLVTTAGTRVVWKNESSQAHTVTAQGSYPLFTSGVKRLITPGHTWSFVFHHAGRYSYYCIVHPFMKGTIVVRPAP